MTEAEWLACTDPAPMLEFLRGKAIDRKVRLFACAFVRRIWASLPDEKTREAVEAAELYADGHATVAELAKVWEHAHLSYRLVRGPTSRVSAAFATASPPSEFDPGSIASLIALHVAWVTNHQVSIDPTESAAQAVVLRCALGNPFRPVAFDPAWLAWNDGAIRKMAQVIYDDRTFDRLPLLADALEDAGCTDGDILTHCRGTGVHVRGCWVVDLLLGKS